MKVLKKSPDKDFIVLNITDPQLSTEEWANGHLHRKILETTMKALMERVQPDLITVSGDLAWAGQDAAYDAFATFIDSFQIPWAPIWGNHDNQNGPEFIDRVADRYLTYKHCLYEKGDPALGNGNYLISIEENGKPVEALVMVDSHDKTPFTAENSEEHAEWAKLTPAQGVWLTELLSDLNAKGPILSYNYGHGSPERVKSCFKIAFTIVVLGNLAGMLFMILFPSLVAGMFTEEEALVSLVSQYMPLFLTGMTIFGLQRICQNTFVALGQAKVSLFIALLRKVILLVPLAYILPSFMGVTGVYAAEAIADATAATLCTTIFFCLFGRILKKSVEGSSVEVSSEE